MSETFFETCVNWSCVTRYGCRTTSSTLFTVLGFLRHKMKKGACTWYLVTDLAGHLELVGHLEK
jgi:hypothetical protein